MRLESSSGLRDEAPVAAKTQQGEASHANQDVDRAQKTSGRAPPKPDLSQKVKHCCSLHDVKRCQTQPARNENDATCAVKKGYPWRAASRAPRAADL